MGLFSEKVTTIGTTVSRVLKDNALPDSILTGVSKTILNDEQDQMVENILDTLISNIGIKAEQMYNYGKSGYLYGVPKSTLFDPIQGVASDVLMVLTQVLGYSPSIEYAEFGAPNLHHMTWLKLTQSYGYDQTDNTLTYSGHQAYLTDFVIHITPTFAENAPRKALQQWGVSPKQGFTPRRRKVLPNMAYSPIVIDANATENHAVVSICWGKAAGATATFIISLADLDFTQDFFQAKYLQTSTYTREGETGPYEVTEILHIGYWSYQEGLGTYETLDAVFSTEWDDTGQFFPFGYFRFKKKDCLNAPTSDEYKSSKKLMHFLGMDFETVAEAIKGNKDIKDVESALLMFGVPANTTDPHELRYLYDFFHALALRTGGQSVGLSVDPDDPAYGFVLSTGKRWVTPSYGYIIQDKRFKMAIAMDGLNIVTKAGTIGSVGTYTHKASKVKFASAGVSYRKETVHLYRYQVTETMYKEIQVVGLYVKYHVRGTYATTADETDAFLLIPLDHSLTKHYPLPFREKLYARSLHYVFNSYVVTKLKWYQSSFFQFVLIVIAVVITILSWGSDGGKTLAAVMGATSSAAVWAILQPILIRILIATVAAKLFVKLFGEKIAFLAAIIAACYGVYSAYEAGGLANAPWAKELLSVSSSLTSAVNSSFNDKIEGIWEDMEDFQDYATAQEDALEAAQDLLINDKVALNPFVVFGESPANYYNRTVHSGNIGTTCFDLIENFVDLSLRLPEFSQTIDLSSMAV